MAAAVSRRPRRAGTTPTSSPRSLIGIAAGAITAVIIGLPAVRIQGLYLAVTTLAFGYAMQYYFLNINYWFGRHLLPSGFASTIHRPTLYGNSRSTPQPMRPASSRRAERTFYFVCLILLCCACSPPRRSAGSTAVGC